LYTVSVEVEDGSIERDEMYKDKEEELVLALLSDL